MTKARLEEVIIVESDRGLGIDESDPIRKVTSIFRKDGTLLAEIDSKVIAGVTVKNVFTPPLLWPDDEDKLKE